MPVVLSVVGKYDGKDLDRAQKELNKLKNAAGDTAGPLSRIGDSFKSAGKSMTDFGKSMTTKVTLPLLAVGAGIGKTIQMASDLSETQSKVGEIFGSSAKDIENFAATAAQNLGQSKQQAMDAAAQFAIFGKSAGLSGGQLVGFSTNLTTLATDLASFNNTSPEEAITAIGAALRGEAEPIRKYGVLLDDASLRQEALRQGLVKTTKEALTPQQKVLAAQALIFKQTETAQGDFARTSDGLANQQRILKAELTNVGTELGTSLLPIALQLAQFFADKVVPAIQKVADWFGGLSDKTKTMILIAGGLLAALGPVITIVGTLATAIGFLISPVGLVVLGIAALVAGLIYAYTHFEGFRKVVDKTFQVIKSSALAAFEWLKQNWHTIVDIITKPFQVIIGFIQRHWDTIEGIFRSAFKVITGIFDVFAGIFTGDWSRVWNGLKGIISGAVSGVINQLKLFVGLIYDSFKGLPGKVIDIGKNLVSGIWEGVQGMSSWLMGKLKDWALSIIPGWMKKVLGIQSPSKVMAEIGGNIAEGLAVGIDENSASVERAMTTLHQNLENATFRLKQAIARGASDTTINELKAYIAQTEAQLEVIKKRHEASGQATGEAYGNSLAAGIKKSSDKVKKAAKDALEKLKGDAQGALDAIKDNAKNVVEFAQNIAGSLRSFGSVSGFNTGALQSAIDDASSIDQQLIDQAETVNKAMGALWEARASTAEDKAARVAAAEKQLNQDQQKYFDLTVARGKAQQKIDNSNYTAKNVIGDMSSRLAQIRTFGQALQKLKDLGLNNASLQEIISAGPKDGTIIAQALLSEGAGAIGQVNDLESQLQNVTSSIGDLGAQSQFGMDTATAGAIVNSTLTLSPGAVVVNIGGNVSDTDKASIAAQVQTAVGNAMVAVLDQTASDTQGYVDAAFMALGQAAKRSKPARRKKG